MSSSKSHRSLSGSVHDSESESSIEYVQTQSPLSPNIPLTTPIASSMNVSGLNIGVGNPKVPTSTTWPIPNISVTPIPANPTNTQMYVSQGPEGTPQISSNANPQLKFQRSRVHVGNERGVDGRQRKKPLENLTWSGLSEGNPGLMLHKNMAPKGKDSHWTSSSIYLKAKNSSCQFIERKIVDDEDENMSLTQMETNDEPRRDNFTVHEHGTQSNSEFTHPQMPLAQSMLEQSEVRQQRNQARKAHNVAKRASQKEQQKWPKEELPDNVHGMRSKVHSHCLFLLKVRDKDFSSLPAPPSTEERELATQVAGHLEYVPKDVFNEPSTQVQSQGFQSYCKHELHKLGLKRFTWDWVSSWQHLFNQLMSMLFYRTFRLTLVSTEYHHYCWKKYHNNYGVRAALMERYFTYLKREWKSTQQDAEYLVEKKENQKLAKIHQRVS
ncbi:hypothetical protein O181_084519 [Austropuccinia psidii MF-1]|uniref:Uncharacterized protein n=1 Tax=Austropuccinia psidii MF-1 TaxID=1389203 RepID=A0A9Q3FTK9_9BASI|nr:hypothetical protein [Austropuccinia psidii MF-1]